MARLMYTHAPTSLDATFPRPHGWPWPARGASAACPCRLPRGAAGAGPVLPAVTGSVPGSPAGTARADDATVQLNNMRTGWDPSETAMGPSVVPRFVRRFATAVNGQVYAQPLVIDSTHTVIVATENDQVYGLNATTGAVKWHTSLGKPYDLATSPFPALRSCHDLYPNIGVTGTPVYNPSNRRLYVFAQVAVRGNPKYDLFVLNAVERRRRLVGTHSGPSQQQPQYHVPSGVRAGAARRDAAPRVGLRGLRFAL